MSSINVSGYGSLVNAVGNQTRSKIPEVGMGVTELMYSDRHPYTVIGVISSKLIVVSPDKATMINSRGESEGQEYTYERDATGPVIHLRLNKFGRWKRVGDPTGSTFLIGHREEYYDFTR